MTALETEEFYTPNNGISSLTAKEFSVRMDGGRDKVTPAEERFVNHPTRDDNHTDRDEAIESDQQLEDSDSRLYMERQETTQGKENLRNGTTSAINLSSTRRQINARMTMKGSSKRQRNNQGKRHDQSADKCKINTVVSVTISKRINALHELGKNRVMVSRELAASKLFQVDNLAANAAILSDTRVSRSEIAGNRLYDQARRSGQKKFKVRQTVRTAPRPHMELATHHGKRETAPTDRFLALYEEGRNRIVADRELAVKKMKKRKYNDFTAKPASASNANVRQVQLYEIGRQKIINQRLNDKYHDEPSYKKKNARYANGRQANLYEMGRQRIIDRRTRIRTSRNGERIPWQ